MNQRVAGILNRFDERTKGRLPPHPIPEMTDPIGKHWAQPPRSSIEVDATHALMERWVFEALHEYSTSFPTGVYVGKMWKRAVQEYGPQGRIVRTGEWELVWFGHHGRPNTCSNNYRKILIVD